MIPSAVNRLRVTTPRVAGLLCAGLGLFVLSGWTLDVPWIKSVLPGAVTMKANAAVGFLLAGVALCLLDAEPSRRRWRSGQAIALVVAVVGLATLSQFVLGWSLGIDELIFRDASVVLNRHPGRMSPYTAIAFSLLGLGLAAIPSRRLQWLVVLAGGMALFIGGVSFVGYLWNATELVTDQFAAPVAIHTGIGFILLGAGTLMATRASGEQSTATLQQLSSVERKALGAFLATVILLFAAGGVSYRASVRESDSAALVSHTIAVQARLGNLYAAVSDAESQQRNYILSGEAGYLDSFESSARNTAAELEALARLVADNDEQTPRLANLRAAVGDRLEVLRNTSAIFDRSGLDAARARIKDGEGQRLMEAVRTEIRRMDAIEDDLLVAHEAEVARDKVVTLVSLLATLTVALVGFLFLFRAIQREMRSRALAERELERFFNISLDFLCISSADGYFKRISPAVTDILGWGEEEFLGTPFIEMVHPDDRAATLREVSRQVLAGEKVLRFENRYRHKDGGWRTLSWRSVPQAGGLMYASARDVTELKLAEKALRESEESLEVTLHSIGDAVLATDIEGRITRMNPVAERLTGWRLDEAQGRPVAEVFRMVHEETRQAAVIPVEQVLATGEIQGLASHTVLIARDGSDHPIADSAAPIRDRAGSIIGVVLVARDISKERDALATLEYERSLLNALMDNMPADIYFKDLESRILRSNRSHARRLGLGDPAKAEGKTDFDFFSDEHAEQALEDERQVIRTGEPISKEEKETWPDGRVTWAFTVKVPLLDKEGKAAGTFGISHDITEHKESENAIERLNADLRRQAAQLEVANKELEAFSYSVSHDLRAPLRHVQGYVEMLARDAQDRLSERSRRYLQTISEAARDMGRLIDDLLSFSRMARAELREESVDLDALVDEVRGELALAAGDRDIRWTVPRLPAVRGDQAMLKQVLANLLDNAVKYTRKRSVAEIEIGFASGGDGLVEFFVRDNGAGFDMKYADKLFGVFQRLHRADEFEGTGIGLANVRRIIARHGGNTRAEGLVELGATFYFSLSPAAAEPVPNAQS